MSVGVLERPATGSTSEPSSGGVAARRAMVRWSWRLFKREWRQQFLILLLIIVAVAAVVVGSAVAVNTPPASTAGFGTAHDLATFTLTPTSKSSSDSPAHVAAQIAQIEHAVGTVQVIANQTFTVPGSTQTYQLRSQDPDGPYGGPMLQLLSGHYPNGPNEIALTPGLASELNLRVGDTWSQGGKTVVGIVQNPQSLLDEFALVPPGQVTHPTQVSVLFDASPNALHLVPQFTVLLHHDAGRHQQQPRQPVHDHPGVGDRGHASHRAGVDRRLHGAGPAPHALPRHARVDGGDRPQRPTGAGGQRRHRRGRGGRLGLRAGPGALAGLPTDQRAERTPRHSDLRAAVERDRAGHGAGGHRDLLRRRLSRPRHHPGAGGQRPRRASRAAAPDPPLAGARCHRTRRGIRLLLHLGRIGRTAGE